ncbi:F-box protein [Rhynchospora pubera]|uniref:F-box protein n=1 Tax=Rhynchospora pubera TaxID=906938 RepID=A0AAV8EGG4_9POAL|nr:F-box protein [Rhynchospora pubera]
MEYGYDLLEWLGPDASTSVFSYLNDPADLVRATAVSRSWRQFIITNGLSKTLCMKLCPEVSYFTGIKEVATSTKKAKQDCSSSDKEWREHERDHKIYIYLSSHLVTPRGTNNCISYCIGASSTDNYPEEIIENTLDSTLSYWSSSGQVDPTVLESLTYQLNFDLGFVDKISIQPFKAFFQLDDPIYSSKYVRFKMGYSKSPNMSTNFKLDQGRLTADENYVWTYISPEFPMLQVIMKQLFIILSVCNVHQHLVRGIFQEDIQQAFRLPRPALCIGGVVKIEFLGRIQKQDMDDLFYICIRNVQVKGRALSPVLGVDLSEIKGGCVLKYCPSAWRAAVLDGYVVSGTKVRRNLLQFSALTAWFWWWFVPLYILGIVYVFFPYFCRAPSVVLNILE